VIISDGLAIHAVESGARHQYPTRPIRLLAPIAPGGGNDNAARLVGNGLGEVLGQHSAAVKIALDSTRRERQA